jgi:tRNA A-37 threonylcarbamoyl transferase component Bud32
MLKINLSKLNSKIDKHIKEYYGLTEKPITNPLDKDKQWIENMIAPYVEYAIINLELEGFSRINVSERYDMSKRDDNNVMMSCSKKKGYDVVKRLTDYSNKYLVKGNKTAKVQRISLWEYKQKGEMKSALSNEFKIGQKAFELGVGPKVHDVFVCFNEQETNAYKVVVSDYIVGEPLEEWLNGTRTPEEKKQVYELVKSKIDKLHANGIIHNSLYAGNVIIVMQRGKIADVYITDYLNAKDTLDKSMWEFNDWIKNDRRVLNSILSNKYFFDISDDVTLYVANKLIEKRDIIIS